MYILYRRKRTPACVQDSHEGRPERGRGCCVQGAGDATAGSAQFEVERRKEFADQVKLDVPRTYTLQLIRYAADFLWLSGELGAGLLDPTTFRDR